MRLLLDTHVLLWTAALSSRLPQKAREQLEDTNNEIYCSTASLWEIAIKSALRRPDFEVDIKLLRSALSEMGIFELPIAGHHTEKVAELPAIHKDPFDRMLIAQSMTEPLVLMTNDAILRQYWDGVILV